MSDFLTRLAERTMGVAAVARPDLAPVFAPAPSQQAADPVVAPIDSVSKPAPPPLIEPPTRSSVPRLSAEVRLEAQTHHAKVELGPGTMQAPEQPSRALFREPEKPGVVRPSTDGPEPPRQRRIIVQSQPLIASKQSPAAYDAGPASPPIAATRTSGGLDAKWTEATPPTINVTIGRIEVRAVTATPPARVERRLPAPQSLNEYLKARNEGRR
jgi:hypothetical protein